MKKSLLFAICLIISQLAIAQYAPAGDSLKTRWAAEVTPENVWQEYPRPQMERTEWLNLNGLWDYAMLPKGQWVNKNFDGKILVPFCIESSLSGVQKYVGKDNELWYQREFEVPSKWNGKRIMLNFGAVDWKCDVWVNDIKVGSHTGGYTPFSIDITQALKKKGNTLKVRVWDPTDQGEQPCGKQHVKPHGIWYTPVTGIWQTVWLEPVNENHIKERAKLLSDKAKEVWEYPKISEEELAPYCVEEKPAQKYSLDIYDINVFTKTLFEVLDKRIMNLSSDVKREYKKLYIAYKLDTNFVDVVVQKQRLRISVNMKFSEIHDPKGICKDITGLGRWGNGDVELFMEHTSDVDNVMEIIEQSYRMQAE